MGATKGLERRQAEHLASLLRPVVNERFGGNETAAARAAGVSQSQFNQLLRATGRGAGVSVLTRLRSFLGMSIDDLLGLPPLSPRTADPMLQQAIRDVLTQEMDRLASQRERPRLLTPTPAKPPDRPGRR